MPLMPSLRPELRERDSRAMKTTESRSEDIINRSKCPGSVLSRSRPSSTAVLLGLRLPPRVNTSICTTPRLISRTVSNFSPYKHQSPIITLRRPTLDDISTLHLQSPSRALRPLSNFIRIKGSLKILPHLLLHRMGTLRSSPKAPPSRLLCLTLRPRLFPSNGFSPERQATRVCASVRLVANQTTDPYRDD